MSPIAYFVVVVCWFGLFVAANNGKNNNLLYMTHQHNNPSISELVTVDIDTQRMSVVSSQLTGSEAFFASNTGFLDTAQTRYITQTWVPPHPVTILNVDLTNGNLIELNFNFSFSIFAYEDSKNFVWALQTLGQTTAPSTMRFFLAIDLQSGDVVQNVTMQYQNPNGFYPTVPVWDAKKQEAIMVFRPYNSPQIDGVIVKLDPSTGDVVKKTALPGNSIWAYPFTVWALYDPSEGKSGYLFAVTINETSSNFSTQVIVLDLHSPEKQWTLNGEITGNAYPAVSAIDTCKKRIVVNMFPPQNWTPPMNNNSLVYWDYKHNAMSTSSMNLATTYQNEYRGFIYPNPHKC